MAPWKLVLALLGVVVVLAIVYILFVRSSQPGAGTPSLPVEDYVRNANSMRQNTYHFEGLVKELLTENAGMGRLYEVAVKSKMGDRDYRIAVLVPEEFNHRNVYVGQSYIFVCKVLSEKGREGLLEVKQLHSP